MLVVENDAIIGLFRWVHQVQAKESGNRNPKYNPNKSIMLPSVSPQFPIFPKRSRPIFGLGTTALAGPPLVLIKLEMRSASAL